jgi:hypothetical protein
MFESAASELNPYCVDLPQKTPLPVVVALAQGSTVGLALHPSGWCAEAT